MTLSDQRAQQPQAAPQTTSSPDASPIYSSDHGRWGVGRGPEDILERWADHVVEVDDSRQLLESSLAERQAAFQLLVRHYLSQILHGCENANCDTRTCLSSVVRCAPRPTRPPTQLTARALAHYLACQNDAREGLCPHKLKVPPAALQVDGAVGAAPVRGHGRVLQYSVFAAPWRLLQPSPWPHSVGLTALEGPPGEVGGEMTHKTVAAALKKRHQTKKDAKSISQNLFDSATMIFSYSKQIPSPETVFEGVRSSSAAAQRPRAEASAKSDLVQTRTQSTSRETRAKESSRESLTSPADRADTTARPLALSSAPADTQASLPCTETLRNGHQIHKIPYHPDRHKSSQPSRRRDPDTPSDAIPLSPKLLIMKTGRKNFTLGATPSHVRPTIEVPPVAQTVEPESDTRRGIPILSNLTSDILRDLNNQACRHRKTEQLDTLNYNVDFDPKRLFRPSKPAVNRSLYYTLSNPELLLKSFHSRNPKFSASPLPHLDSSSLSNSFSDWSYRNGALVFDSLCMAVDALFIPPPVIRKSPTNEENSSSTRVPSNNHRYLSNLEAAHIAMICIHALTSHVRHGWPQTWIHLRMLRSWGILLANDDSLKESTLAVSYLDSMDAFNFEPAMRLANHLLQGIGARACFDSIITSARRQKKCHQSTPRWKPEASVLDIILGHLHVAESVQWWAKANVKTNSVRDPGWTMTSSFMEWLKTVIVKQWDSKPIIDKWSSVGTAVRVLDEIHRYRKQPFEVQNRMFELPFLRMRLDVVDEPMRFLEWKRQPNHLHLFEYPLLFSNDSLVTYFRTMNFHLMMMQYNHTTRTSQLQRTFEMFVRDPQRWLLNNRMKVTLGEYLFLDISRHHPLEDTLNQLWNVEKRMLRKPLKVKLGKDEGEVGLDHGGVTYEFFRIVLSEAFDPDYGMFVIDPKTHMTWFQQDSLEPEWKFEMIGMIFSLAIYNGITLPVTFPLALYRFLLPFGAPMHDRELASGTNCIKDGWPDLAKSFDQLLNWTDGDVGDAIMRDYAFSYEAFGKRVDHNMEERYVRFKHPSSASKSERPVTQPSHHSEPKLVTNDNRTEFVVDYIKHLTYLSVEPQITAFRRGFNTCLHPKSLHLFSPTTLRNLVEGDQHISIPELRRITCYEAGYSSTHPTILAFWSLVENFSQEDRRHLLEFVTASDRVPVTGYRGIVFHIVRYGGSGEVDKLPTSSTCFGKLYLPDYQEKERMKEKLELAIRNSKGFGVV